MEYLDDDPIIKAFERTGCPPPGYLHNHVYKICEGPQCENEEYIYDDDYWNRDDKVLCFECYTELYGDLDEDFDEAWDKYRKVAG